MTVEVVMPAMEWGQESARLVRWLKGEGEYFNKGEPLMEIETDKVTVEIEAPASGTLASIAAHPGDEVAVGRVVAVLLGEGEVPSMSEASQPSLSAQPAPASTVLTEAPEERPVATALKPASPRARRLAFEYGLDVAKIAGSGPESAVLVSDVEAANAARPQSVRAAEDWTVVPLEGIRKTIADRMQASWTAPHISLTVTADMTSALKLLEEQKVELGQELTLTALMSALLASPLLEHRRLNALLVDRSLRLAKSVDIGIAVALPEGLIVPVIRSVERKTVAEIQTELNDLVARARGGALLPSEVRGSTFTLSNLGMFGIEHFTAILNPPEVALLAVGAVRESPVGVDGRVVLRPMMRMTLIADHRAVDGAVAAAFLRSVKDKVERPLPEES